MSTIQSIHTFTEGMDKDTHPQYKSKAAYDHAENLRYYANAEGTTGDLRNIKSSTRQAYYITNATYYGTYQPMHVAGSCVVGDYMVIFASDYINEYIFRYKIGDSELKTIYRTYSSYAFGISNPTVHLDVVGRYESADVIKVYWTVPGQGIKMANIAKPLTTTGLDDTNYLPYNRFNINTNVSLSVPVLTKVFKGGNLTSGKVQYAYSLYRKGAQETSVSPLSLPTPLFTSTNNTTRKRLGDEEIVNTGKSVSVSISISSADSSYYNYLTLYRVHYTSFNGTPTVTIVGNYALSSSSTNIITDIGGDGLGTLSIEEFSILYKSFFSASTLESKNNRLFAANIIDQNFDLDFDARAYRFNSYGTARIDQDYSGTGAVTTVTPSNWTTISSTHPCVLYENGFSGGITPRTTYEYLYQSNGATKGGEGPNMKYSFLTDSAVIDTSSSNYSIYSSQEGYNNETEATLRVGYQRGEVYRFGVVFYNSRGQASTVKWIGDIRMPSLADLGQLGTPYSNAVRYSPTTNRSTRYSIGMSFTLKSMPAGAVGWQIVRAKRTDNDKSVLMTGVLSYTRTKTYSDAVTTTDIAVKSGLLNCNRAHGWLNSPSDSQFAANERVVSFISPDMFYSSVTILPGDYVSLQGRLEESINNYSRSDSGDFTGSNYQEVIKYRTINYDGWYTVGAPLTNIKIEEAAYTSTSNPSTTFGINNAGSNDLYDHLCIWGQGSLGGPAGELDSWYAEAGSCYTLSLSHLLSSTTDGFTLPYVHILRNSIGRYGGYTAEDREKTEYISCSGIFTTTGGMTVMGGDTYIGFFGYSNALYTETLNDVSIRESRRLSNHALLLMESQVNLDLTHDINYFRSSSDNRWLIKENAKGVEITANGGAYTFIPETNLYQYNTVYSTEQNLAYTYSASDNDSLKHEGRVYYSDYKKGNEEKDSWCIFRANNFLDVDLKYGPIRRLKKWNNEVYFFQERAVGLLPIDQRALVESSSIGALQMGVAGVLDYYRYITEYQGLTNAKDIVCASKGIYWYDSKNKAIIRYNGSSIQDLTMECKINSYIKSLNLTTLGTLGYDYQYNEVLFKLSDANVLVFNEVNDKFISIYTYTPIHYLETRANLYYFVSRPYEAPDLAGYRLELYEGNSQTSSWNYFSAGDEAGQGVQESSLTVTDADNYLYTKVYDNLRFDTKCVGSDGHEYNNTTFNNLLAYNRFQYTGDTTLTMNSNLMRREREYTLALPRNIVNNNGSVISSHIDITDPANHDSSRTYSERLRDKTLTVKLTRGTGESTSFSIPYLTFIYRASKR